MQRIPVVKDWTRSETSFIFMKQSTREKK